MSKTALPPFAHLTCEQLREEYEEASDNFTKALDDLDQRESSPLSRDEYLEYQAARGDFGRIIGIISHLNGVSNTDELRSMYSEIQPLSVALSSRWDQHPVLYEYAKSTAKNMESQNDTTGTKRAAKLAALNAELAGIGLEPDARKEFTELQKREATLGTEFSNNVTDATKEWSLRLTDPEDVSGLPEFALEQMAENARKSDEKDASATAADGPWVVTLDPPLLSSVLQNCDSRSVRELAYRANLTRASELEGGRKITDPLSEPPHNNGPLIREILWIRQQRAKMLGLPDYASVSLKQKMAQDPDTVVNFLEDLRNKCYDTAQAEYEEVAQFAKDNGHCDTISQWDVSYWAEKLRQTKFGLNEEKLREYFPFNKVLEGTFALVEKLFGVSIEAVKTVGPGASDASENAVEVWDEHVSFHILRDTETQKPIAGFYLDPYSRPGSKRGGAWMDSLNDRSNSATVLDRLEARGAMDSPHYRYIVHEGVRLPIAYLVCNQGKGVAGPPLMRFSEISTLVHELGHGLQHMLTRVDEMDTSGINGVDWDAVEFPSQFMENWCYESSFLKSISSHYKSGEALPDDLIERIRASRKFMAGSFLLRQLRFARTDMELHRRGHELSNPNTKDCGFDPFELERQVAQRHSVMPLLDEDRFLCSFAHIFASAYAAGYYSYLWAQVLAADAYAAFKEGNKEDPTENNALGRQFRESVLSLGGSIHPMDVFKKFRGREPDSSHLIDVYLENPTESQHDEQMNR